MRLDKNTYGTVILVYIVCSLAASALVLFVNYLWVVVPSVVFLVAVAIWQTLFHMVPNRVKQGSDRIVTAVSDGIVVINEIVNEDEWFAGESRMISIYMDFWDVHANFWPVDGEVVYTKYHPGKHFLAFKPKASEENEHTCTAIRTSSGSEVFFKQLAGGFARRIVCYAKHGMNVKSGEQCGIIKFGSRIDIFLPVDADVKVKLGEKVRACESVVAHLK